MASLMDKLSGGLEAGRRRSLILSYSIDWTTTIILFIVFALIDKVPGFKREFDVNDTSIQHTFAVKERVPFYAAFLLAAIVPAAIMLMVGGVIRRSFYDVHSSFLGLFLSLALTTTLTDIVKITVGRPRPDFLDRCQLIAGTVNAAPYGLTTVNPIPSFLMIYNYEGLALMCTHDVLLRIPQVAACTQTKAAILNDGFKSFFSGHASVSFAGLGFLSFYLAGKMHLFSDKKGYAFKAWLSLAPLVVAGTQFCI